MMFLTPMGRFGDPFADMWRLQREMNRLFSTFEGRPATAGNAPPVNLWVGENSVVVTAQLPGVGPDDVDLSVRGDSLAIRCKRLPQAEGQRAWHRRERAHGEFARLVDLPFRVDAGNVQARLTDGVLEVELQRPETDRPRRIQVNAT